MARILILEDDEWVASCLAGLLRGAGHLALETRSGPEAERLARLLMPELIIVDSGMDGDGYLRAIASIRRLSPKLKTIVCASEPGDARLRRVAAACAADRALDWTADSADLLAAISEALGLRLSPAPSPVADGESEPRDRG
jgi:DNA-binding NarL/FixJ family response regulator